MPEEALLDAAVETEPIESTESPVETLADDSESTDTSTEGAESSADSPELQGSTLWRNIKDPLFSGKALNKDQIKAVKRAIQESAAISQKYPEGLGQIESTLAAVKSLSDTEGVPIEQAIQETLQERSYFRELDNLYTTNPAQFAQKIREASPEAFENLAPAVIRQYAEANPEAYLAQVAQAVVQHMQGAEVPLQFRILSTFLPQLPDGPAKDQVIQACEALFGWSEGLKALSQKKIEPKQVPQAQSSQNQTPNGVDPQMDLTRREWNLETRDEGVNLVYSLAQKEVAGLRKSGLTDVEKKKVLGKVSEEIDARLMVDNAYKTSMQAYLKSGNKNSYIQLMNSKRKAIVPNAVKRAVQDVIAERPAKQVAQTANGKQPATQSLKPVQGAVQFRKIAGPPKTLKLMVDLNRTPQSMLVKRQAYIKGEDRPVTWA